jgi:hypothetical protein
MQSISILPGAVLPAREKKTKNTKKFARNTKNKNKNPKAKKQKQKSKRLPKIPNF